MFCIFASLANAVRTTTTISAVANPQSAHKVARIINSGEHRIGGGVFFDGTTTFVLEDGDSKFRLNSRELQLEYSSGSVFLLYKGVRYNYDMHAELVCPLSKFTLREANLAYSIPSDRSDLGTELLSNMGLVPVGRTGSWIAREFLENELPFLLFGMDFAEVTPLPDHLELQIRNEVNKLTDGVIGGLTAEWDSYVNTDSMSNITTYLVRSSTEVEIAGVPLRFYWRQLSDQKTQVVRVEAYSQKLGSTKLTEFSSLDKTLMQDLSTVNLLVASTQFNQIDYVSAYQSAALFKTLHALDSSNFLEFSVDACQ